MVRVLLVCTGNICRSPMAEGLLRRMIRDSERSADVVVESAGTGASARTPVSPNAAAVAAETGIDLRGHLAREVDRRLLDRADLILTMSPEHGYAIRDMDPASEGKTHLITLYGDPHGDPDGIPDPMGGDLETYRETFGRIEASLERALPRILAMIPEGTEPEENRTGTGR